MGELSAKHLRGDNMADVVFNGSSARKPVGTASVELVFDNCRRQDRRRLRELQRDLAQAPGVARRHLGLLHQRRALPPQGHHATVSRHRPRLAQLRDHRAGHDLARHRGAGRGHARLRRGGRRHLPLQGAAQGDRERASPRRARTSSACRTCATRSRSRSATCSARPHGARRYQALKEQERRLTAELLALRLRELDSGAQVHDSAVRARELAMQAALADAARRRGGDREAARRSRRARASRVAAVQGRYYEIGAEISRLEQTIQHTRELRERQRADLAQTRATLADLGAHIERDERQLADAARGARAARRRELERGAAGREPARGAGAGGGRAGAAALAAALGAVQPRARRRRPDARRSSARASSSWRTSCGACRRRPSG